MSGGGTVVIDGRSSGGRASGDMARPASVQLAVDWIACDGRGLCAELLPERIGVDEWGYPTINAEPLSSDLLPDARRAVAACPKLALRLIQR
jgi:ferredoxin